MSTGQLLGPTEPWEMWRLFVINVLLVGNERRLYYMCQAVPNGAGSAEAEAAIKFGQGNHSCCPGEEPCYTLSPNLTRSQNSLCVATSTDG